MKSINHHYVPQLYLRGFTANNGRLQVFDKEFGEFKSDKQTPRSILFEKNRNSVSPGSIYPDVIEEIYSSIESPFGDFFNHVRRGISSAELITHQGINILKSFIAVQFWRAPCLDLIVPSYMNNLDFDKFGDELTVKGIVLGKTKKIQKLIATSQDFRMFFRSFILPHLTFDLDVIDEDFKNWKLYTVDPAYGQWDNNITGDNSLVVEKLEDMFAFKSKFVFPLSKNQLITYSPNGGDAKILPPVFTSLLSMNIFNQCQRYVVGANRDYMQGILSIKNEWPETVTELRESLFNYI
ncbi:DUF4238 domain-containing protein [Vibrio tritonius]|uniref:DUF4238 domain-containing protein n=1 Tax=Vibrio tritonius TaxID=1435069 RepID=UPI00315DA63C